MGIGEVKREETGQKGKEGGRVLTGHPSQVHPSPQPQEPELAHPHPDLFLKLVSVQFDPTYTYRVPLPRRGVPDESEED